MGALGRLLTKMHPLCASAEEQDFVTRLLEDIESLETCGLVLSTHSSNVIAKLHDRLRDTLTIADEVKRVKFLNGLLVDIRCIRAEMKLIGFRMRESDTAGARQ